MLLAAELWRGLNGLPALQANYNFTALCSAFNFGPNVRSNRTVEDLVLEVLKTWPGSWCDQSDPDAPHEASLLNLSIDKAYHMLSWSPFWGFKKTVEATMNWYIAAESEGTNLLAFTRAQISKYSVGAVNN
jgi:CDP-glucose 4,6-dehydratase